MSLNHSFKSARNKIERLDAQERTRLMEICADIHHSQKLLSKKAVSILEGCMVKCRGLCCRNILPADIITEWDLVYVLAMAPQVGEAMGTCLTGEGFFSSDCIFLENGVGPCLFPDNVRPERCIISFCRVEPSVEKEIGEVTKGFSRLIRFFKLLPLRRLANCFLPTFIGRRNGSN
jgi:hypothetical protein